MIHPEDREWSRLARYALLRLSATDYDARFNTEFHALARLKIHFSLLDDESDEVDLVKTKYYGKVPKWVDIALGAIIFVLLAYLTFTR